MAATWRRRLTLLALLLCIAAGGALFAVYRAAQHVPDFYAAACDMPEEVAAKASDEFSDQAFDLANDVEKIGSWSALFTDEQINGWLATDLVKKHPELLPPGFENPRVRLLDDHAQVGVRYTVAGMPTVAWIDVDAALTKDREIAIRFREVNAGSLPLPMATIMDALSNAARTLEVPLRWTTLEDRPTAVIGLPQPENAAQHYELSKISVTAGRLFLSGRTYPLGSQTARITQ